ncbi:tRNA (N6-threonylcarbamoyladenosine(37)-N6)-methyltransferase TrmO [Mucilaginibacter flavidus]|uniref:tRNA (N6-threonylcarbamoyladenosine(37)-N6)-methyltransferase TrmO n=1 Tax=Mucilaginibacter flavidus TaxID=2949309 RepID=UPI002093CD52|nr:tRNA (N6-threonylcarbamoyladenosine(37)-N6)-methyltransferase TrmO [Mucilaginibacter flavidus]MCO5947638.1 tRNA (N6-threonylcarbamoyladenosine(37)-N6)-methyltransferase TrmO [Mucilaginibacter flavidus]
MDAKIKYIGKINSALKTIEDCPLQGNENAPDAEVIIYPEFIEGIKDLKSGAEILLLTWLHAADRSVIKCYPRNNIDAPVVGVFSTRSRARPNPIGIHPVTVIDLSAEGVIKVAGLEALDQTPVIDIKPLLR